MSRVSTEFGIKEKLLLSIGVPCVILAILEVLAQLLVWCGVGGPPVRQPTAMEMPTWMLRDANALARAKPTRDAFEWLSMFVEGDGYRVHLIPHSSKAVKNTFSPIPYDREQRYHISANALGFRGPLLAPNKSPNTLRVLVFGDSSSFGWGVNVEDSWWSILQRSLQQHYPEKVVEIANFAIPGDSSAYGKLIFDTFASRFQSDAVILGFGANDAKGVFTSHTEQVSKFTDKRSLLKIAGALEKSALVSLSKTLMRTRMSGQGKPPPEQLIPAVSVEDYGSNMVAMGRSAMELGNQKVVFLGLCIHPSYARKARQAAKDNGFEWFNGQSQLLKLLPQIQKKEVYAEYVDRMEQRYPAELKNNRVFYVTSDGCHPNELGHRYVADQLTRVLTRTPWQDD